jgi:transcription initiation factor IIE alpha subunit
MKAFAKAVNKAGSINISDTEEVMFVKWLSIITQQEITDKKIIEAVCNEAEVIQMAIATLARQGEDKIIRQAYQRRQDEIFYFTMNMAERDEYKQRAELAEAEIEKLRREIEKH